MVTTKPVLLSLRCIFKKWITCDEQNSVNCSAHYLKRFMLKTKLSFVFLASRFQVRRRWHAATTTRLLAPSLLDLWRYSGMLTRTFQWSKYSTG